MKKKIIIIGSTGKLGSKLLLFSKDKNFFLSAATCFSNIKKLNQQKFKYNIKNIFALSNDYHKKKFINFLKTKHSIFYFLDYGSSSLIYLDIILKYNTNSIIAIANKEMIIAGGKLMFDKLRRSKNIFIPLDSEHFSLKNNFIDNDNIKKIYITASGGPFFFKNKKNFSNVSINEVLAHPKWNMGINNSIDSSNFINKILEIYELSYIYNIDLSKIDFLVSQNAYIHSIIEYYDGITSFNCYINDMLVPLIEPLTFYYKFKIPSFSNTNNLLNLKNFSLNKKYDKRFNFFKYYNKLIKYNHQCQIKLMIANNYAHSQYLSGKLKYEMIIPFIIKKSLNSSKQNNFQSFRSFDQILNFIKTYKISLVND